MLWERLSPRAVKCNLCGWRSIIQAGKRGRCMVRENQNGTLYTLVYGKVASYALDPIEKKPLFHFHPGSTALSVATVGCNFGCQHCQNYSLSHWPRGRDPDAAVQGRYTPPEAVVAAAVRSGSEVIAYTYSEPTVFLEWALDIA